MESSFGDIDGDGTGFLIGYRMSPELRIEFETQDIDYDDLTVDGTRIHNFEGEFTTFSIVLSSHYNN
ncbi:MAG: hypothetical protein L7U47_03820 [Alphaproteobacteria bacterium]|nr:hypothetical protein [Alphaproteobacteria bacterium]